MLLNLSFAICKKGMWIHFLWLLEDCDNDVQSTKHSAWHILNIQELLTTVMIPKFKGSGRTEKRCVRQLIIKSEQYQV